MPLFVQQRGLASGADDGNGGGPQQQRRTLGWVKRGRLAYARFKERKTEMVLLYGSTFVVLHEVLGIASYVITYALVATGVIEIEQLAGFLGFTEEEAQKRGFSLHSRVVTFTATVALVKMMDVMGLVPLRWAINFLITPRVAHFVGPYADRLFSAIKRIVKGKDSLSSRK